MALGGGTFTVQNKVLPGAYINFVSSGASDRSLSDRGVATMPLTLGWGPSEVLEVTKEDFYKNSRKIFGYDYYADEMKPLQDLFMNASKLYAYRLNGAGVAATSELATAKYPGTRGNDLRYVVAADVDNTGYFNVTLYLGTTKIETQTVQAASELVDNEFVVWNDEGELAATAGTPLSGGTDSEVTGANHTDYLNKIEGYAFNTMGVDVTDDTTKRVYVNFVKRVREDVGKKFQLVLYNYAADYEGVINLTSTVKDAGASAASLVYWLTGAEAGCAVNQSCMNKKYDGTFTVNTDYSQSALEAAINAGQVVFHNVSGNVRVLEDLSSLTSVTEEKGVLFKDNKTIRIIDQIANDVAALFAEKYIGQIPNDADGRISLWNDVVDIHNQLARIRAIQNFDSGDITVAEGDSKNAVVITDVITVTGTMEKLYMTVLVQ